MAEAPLIPKTESQEDEIRMSTRCSDIFPRRYWVPTAVAVWLLAGMVYFRAFEGHGWVTSIYAIIQIVTTVGYGDVTPTDQLGKLFMGFYALFGIAVAAGIVEDVVSAFVNAAHEHTRKTMRAIEDRVARVNEDYVWSENKKMKINNTCAALAVWLAVMSFGTMYFGLFDNCLCADGAEECVVPDIPHVGRVCPPGVEVRTLVDAFYMSCITLTTVGFGDQVPQTESGRVVSVLWMVVGIGATANLITRISDLFKYQKKADKALTYQMYKKLDKDEEGRVHRHHFLSHMLQKYDLCSEGDIIFIMKQFDKYDVDDNGFLTMEDLGFQRD